jgi:hypothetical protein
MDIEVVDVLFRLDPHTHKISGLVPSTVRKDGRCLIIHGPASFTIENAEEYLKTTWKASLSQAVGMLNTLRDSDHNLKYYRVNSSTPMEVLQRFTKKHKEIECSETCSV